MQIEPPAKRAKKIRRVKKKHKNAEKILILSDHADLGRDAQYDRAWATFNTPRIPVSHDGNLPTARHVELKARLLRVFSCMRW